MKAASQFDVDTEPFDSESDSESDCKGYRQRRRRDSFIFYSRQYDGRYSILRGLPHRNCRSSKFNIHNIHPRVFD